MTTTRKRQSNTAWRKSSASGPSACVEVAISSNHVLVRNSRHPEGAMLRFTKEEWVAFVNGVHRGEFEV
ncbi:DUF397 domain-containing protein [Bailinhaonella thermotolerans]|uniref:DUF397 domain-containing protein n=1 Tax=Bailinhaonella thermotolerans TaxID=1070861 RepID=A0A3A4AYX5_9ACTN|nr:DUF397 domain-containing protein [Bailinhaonella thermotolerans]RJL32706.1 DUF397 domain-containing protein [Bailinhaonella thermotolerans]